MDDALTQIIAPEDVNELLMQWITTANKYARAHCKDAISLKKRHNFIGAPSAGLSAVVGMSIFAALQEAAESLYLKGLLVSLSMTASALAALVTFYNYGERSAAHRIASQEYEDVARRLEVLKTSISSMSPDDWKKVLDGYSQQLEAIGHRVDIPSSFESVIYYRAINGACGKARVTIPPREGFVDELDRVFKLATKPPLIPHDQT